MKNVEILLDNYYSWLRDKTVWQDIQPWAEITTPYLDRNNDYIQIYLKQDGNDYILTDDGEIIENLAQDGCNLDSQKRRNLLQMTLNGYGVTLDGQKLQVKASANNFPLKKHNLLQAMLAVNDMFFLAEPHISSLFFEDVREWLDDSNVRYSEQISFIGKSGFARKFDFLISKSKNSPERILKTINNPVKNSADSVIMDWMDTREQRPVEAKAFAIINDEKNVSSGVSDAFSNYDITPILWSKREFFANVLSS